MGQELGSFREVLRNSDETLKASPPAKRYTGDDFALIKETYKPAKLPWLPTLF
jgi:hypothetical protein